MTLAKPWEPKRLGDRVVSGIGADWFYGRVVRLEPGAGTRGEDWLTIETDNNTVVCTDHGNVYGVTS